MKKFIALLIFSMISFISFGQDIKGKWNTGKEDTIVEIKGDDVLEGKISSTHNPKGKVGTVILRDLKKKGDHYEGEIYSIKKDEWYNADVKVVDDHLEVKVSVGFLSKTVEWKKK
ncbi:MULTISPECIES: DUF2147 domain-containing protein [Flammeovirga]|uniref:DUF2147 domain-containing protein n=1 Tax=Flammeovirga agarivorans TaxID=2726742 RepID=A0A7X8SJR7_9BACT|nr:MULTISPECIES: DUF2147 domain-containing protein [Flammeovirga]NLR91545.1 DUF2147 domain-containing protein [Flammeovirga agarivorans]